MPLSPQWLDILKASGWKTASIATAAALLMYFNAKKLLPTPLDSWVIEIAEVALLVCGCLWLASVISAAVSASKPLKLRIARYWAMRKATREVEEAIPEMTIVEREILGYLVAHNQRHFTGAQDGGYANTLISKRIVRFAALQGQVCHIDDCPFEIPKHVWEVLNRHKEHLVTNHQEGQPYPWRVPWNAR